MVKILVCWALVVGVCMLGAYTANSSPKIQFIAGMIAGAIGVAIGMWGS